ncbi:hypothetical protein KY289_016683 [Solanum tuberosum]|nr:hypothetical protein KY289_016683 [Solanum tuberosum]
MVEAQLVLAGGPGRPASRFSNQLAGPDPVTSRRLGGMRDRGPVRGRFTLWSRSNHWGNG